MRDDTLRRRLVTIPRTAALFLVLTILAPLLVLATAVVDSGRALVTRRPWMATRLLAMAWTYLAAQMVVVIVGGLHWLAALPYGSQSERKLAEWAYGLQAWWVRFIVAAMERVMGIKFESDHNDVVAPGPVIVLFRHASIMDNLLPYVFVSDRAGIRLRWVLKKELLSDPALDIGGNRMPNYFVDRDSDSPEQERDNIAALGSGLRDDEGVLLFPEGTRFSREKYSTRMERLAATDPDLHAIWQGHDHVLPPRPGGVLALLDTGIDVIFASHFGLENLRGIKEIWNKAPVGIRVRVSFRRVAADEIPSSPESRVRWLHEQWVRVDDTVVALRGDVSN